MRALLIGFGDLAQRLAPKFLAAGHALTGLRRSPLTFPGVAMVAGDCRDEATLRALLEGQDIVVVSLTPGQFTAEAYQASYVAAAKALQAALADIAQPPKHLFWVSSTSVYGESAGEWVDETTPAQPKGFSGQALLAAEAILQQGSVPVTVVRFSGIYGPGRNRLLTQVRAGHCAPAEPVLWTNRIHAEDCAGVLYHLASMAWAGNAVAPLYIGTDCEPVPLHEVHKWLAAAIGVACQTGNGADFMRGNGRCRNDLLLATGYRFLYPSFREGYQALLAATTSGS